MLLRTVNSTAMEKEFSGTDANTGNAKFLGTDANPGNAKLGWSGRKDLKELAGVVEFLCRPQLP